jgi:hypothetical protein
MDLQIEALELLCQNGDQFRPRSSEPRNIPASWLVSVTKARAETHSDHDGALDARCGQVRSFHFQGEDTNLQLCISCELCFFVLWSVVPFCSATRLALSSSTAVTCMTQRTCLV